MVCEVCGTDNKEGRKFCRECGNPLSATCASCGHANEPEDKFCGNCGNSLGNDAAVPAARAAEAPVAAEQRFISVLFADIVGYTTLSEHRDSEDIRDMLTVYFERAREIIERFGGTVDKFIGDAVMGVWGATAAREDDAQRAVRAALELVDMVGALGDELEIEGMQLRAGVNSGRTSVGPGGNAKGLVVGDLVNTASRLQTIADPGTVFVGPSTYEVTQQSIDYEDMGERTVKGKAEAVHAYRAVRVASMVVGRADDEIRQPPFVGRERELRLLKDGLAAVEAENRARLISIVGEAGIGKTRLAEEFKNHIDGYSESIYWHWGRSPSYGDGVTFWALGEIIRRRAGIVEGEDQARSRTRLRTMLAEFVPNEEDREWIEPRLTGLLGLAEMPADSRSELFAALRAFFQNVAAKGPVILVFEDLHWGDGGLMDFISELVERSTRHPILVVSLARPDLLDRRPDWGSQHRSSMSVRVGPLPDADMRRMVAEYIPGVGDGVVDQIVHRVSGFPLYAVEIVRMLSASGDLVSSDGRFSYQGDPADMALPDTLHTVIGARLDRLDPAMRSLLQDGAVLGQTFTLAAISELRREPIDEIEKGLGSLINLELVDLEDDPRSPERGQYRFIQSLIREVAYGRLNRDDRRAKHLAAAEYFADFDDPELAGVIASHFMGAYEATPPGQDRDVMVARALAALTEAATRAADLHSHLQAMDLLDEAIEVAPQHQTRAELMLQAARSAELHGEVERGLAYLGDARTIYQQADDADGVRRAATAQSSILNGHYRSDEALRAVEDVYLQTDSFDDPISLALADEAARSYALTLRIDEALEACERVLAGVEPDEMHDTQLHTLITKGTALAWMGRRIEALTLLRGAAIEAQKRGFLRMEGRALNNLSSILATRNQRESLIVAEQLLQLANRAGEFGWIVRAINDVASQYIAVGRYDDAETLLGVINRDELTEFWQHAFDLWAAYKNFRLNPSPETQKSMGDELAYFSEETDHQIAAWFNVMTGITHYEMGEWREAFDAVVGVDPTVDPAGLWLAAAAAAWLGDSERVERVAAIEGSPIPGFGRYVAAIKTALDGDKESAAVEFSGLLDYWRPRLLPDFYTDVQTVFARVVGLDHPEAAAAAAEAYQWCVDTGTNSLLQAWAEVFPGAEEQLAAG